MAIINRPIVASAIATMAMAFLIPQERFLIVQTHVTLLGTLLMSKLTLLVTILMHGQSLSLSLYLYLYLKWSSTSYYVLFKV